MRVLITASRDWPDPAAVRSALDVMLKAAQARHEDLVVVRGDCPTGGDRDAGEWVAEAGDAAVTEEMHKADWGTYGRSAGPRRNRGMVVAGAEQCWAFIGPCRSARCRALLGPHGSHGATHCASLAELYDIPTTRVEVFE